MKAKCKILVNPWEVWDQVMEAWGSNGDYDDAEGFWHRVQEFEVVCSPWSIFIEYVDGIWLISRKEKFIKALVNLSRLGT